MERLDACVLVGHDAVVRLEPKPQGRDREAFFFAAYEILSEHGYRAVTVQSLCDHLGVTKGSFYHHFEDMSAFVAGFAAAWQGWVVQRFIAYSAERNPRRRLEAIANGHVALMIGAEPAIRAWAHARPELADAIVNVHQVGERLGEATIGEIVGDAELGATLGQIATAFAMGMQQRAQPIDARDFVARAAEVFRRGLRIGVDVVESPGVSSLRLRPELGLGAGFVWPVAARPALAPASQSEVSSFAGCTCGAYEPRGLTRQTYFAAARELLIEHGADAVTIAALCAKVTASKGSFQHHFVDMSKFVSSFADDLAAGVELRLRQLLCDPDPTVRLAGLLQELADVPDPAAPALRAWGWAEPRIAEAVRRIDDGRESAFRQALAPFFPDPATTDLLAGITVDVGIGLEYRVPMFGLRRRRRIVAEWAGRCLGLAVRVHGDRAAWLELGAPALR